MPSITMLMQLDFLQRLSICSRLAILCSRVNFYLNLLDLGNLAASEFKYYISIQYIIQKLLNMSNMNATSDMRANHPKIVRAPDLTILPRKSYIDSSQDEQTYNFCTNQVDGIGKQMKIIGYVDSSEEQTKLLQNNRNFFNQQHHGNGNQKKQKMDRFQIKQISQKQITTQIQKLIAQKINKQKNYNGVLLAPDSGNNEILEQIARRNKKYQFLLRDKAVDQKYRQIIKEKVQQIRLKNQKKQKILQQRRYKQRMEEEARLQRKYTFQKKDIEDKIIRHTSKLLHKKGVQNLNERKKNFKEELTHNDNKVKTKIIDLKTRNKNSIEQLKQEYERMKEIQRQNQIQQKKDLKQLEKANLQKKHLLQTKLKQSRKFQV